MICQAEFFLDYLVIPAFKLCPINIIVTLLNLLFQRIKQLLGRNLILKVRYGHVFVIRQQEGIRAYNHVGRIRIFSWTDEAIQLFLIVQPDAQAMLTRVVERFRILYNPNLHEGKVFTRFIKVAELNLIRTGIHDKLVEMEERDCLIWMHWILPFSFFGRTYIQGSVR